MKAKHGEPMKQWNEEGNKKYYLWITEKTAIKVLDRDAGENVRFEWYNYEMEWFNKNKSTLNIPE